VYQQPEFVLAVHVLSGMLALATGPCQFVRKIRRRFLRLHRCLGVIFIASCTGLGLSGLGLATTSYAGWTTSLAFGFLGVSMLFTTWTALRMVLARGIGDHRRWMIRSIAHVVVNAEALLLDEGVVATAIDFQTGGERNGTERTVQRHRDVVRLGIVAILRVWEFHRRARDRAE
jgi:uncharacterized membrane protein